MEKFDHVRKQHSETSVSHSHIFKKAMFWDFKFGNSDRNSIIWSQNGAYLKSSTHPDIFKFSIY